MAEDKIDNTKLMFVLSGDFGELATAMYFIRGYPFQTVFLMPNRLFQLHQNCVAGSAYLYSSIEDVTAFVEKERPDILFLFSGYLFAINKIFNLETLEPFVQEMMAANRCVVTSDPFLGIMSEINESTFNQRHPLRFWFIEHFSNVSRIFKNVMHLYLIDVQEFVRAPSTSFFNPNILVDRGYNAEQSMQLAASIGLKPDKNRWLFILSTEDYSWQITRHGIEQFREMLVRTLNQAVAAGRQPVLIAPQEAFETYKINHQSIEGLVFTPHCMYDTFMALLFDAEYVFYWNIFSNSIPARLLNHLPVFFFEPGHMVHAIPAMLNAGLKYYYFGSELAYLDQNDMPSLENLTALAVKQDDSLAGAIENFMRSPHPDEMVSKLLKR